MDGTLVQTLKNRSEMKLAGPVEDLSPAEAAVLTLLEQRLDQQNQRQATPQRVKSAA
jgi:hypothetical protein